MINIFRAVQEVGHPEEAEDRQEHEPANKAQDAGNQMCRAANTILQSSLYLSSLAVGDGYGVRSEAEGCYDNRLGLNHGGGDLLLGLRGRRTLR